jgi:hypothetical protein
MGKPTKLKPPKKKTKKQEASDDEVSSEGHDGTVDDRLLVKNGFHILPISLYGTDGIKYLYFRPQKKRSKTSTPRTSGAFSGSQRVIVALVYSIIWAI